MLVNDLHRNVITVIHYIYSRFGVMDVCLHLMGKVGVRVCAFRCLFHIIISVYQRSRQSGMINRIEPLKWTPCGAGNAYPRSTFIHYI